MERAHASSLPSSASSSRMATTITNLRAVRSIEQASILSGNILTLIYLQALMDSQAAASISSEELQSLRLVNAKLEAEAAAGPRKSKGNKKLAPSMVLEEYSDELRKFANMFTLMDFPWVEPKAFLQPRPLVPTLSADQRYQDDTTTLLHMRHRLYDSCPQHLGIYIEKLGDFGTNVSANLHPLSVTCSDSHWRFLSSVFVISVHPTFKCHIKDSPPCIRHSLLPVS
jgi:hypothetical protein